MPEIYDTTNPTNTADNQMFNGKRGEFGLPVFSDPQLQTTFGQVEDKYKKMLELKCAYDKQEFLRKMRADIRREYLTRKKQLKLLQKDAAVDFRNAEFSLQEHIASDAAHGGGCHYGVKGIDTCAPLVSQIQLPGGEILDLKTFDAACEFEKMVQNHRDLQRECEEMAQQHQRQQEQQEAASIAWYDRTPPSSNHDDDDTPTHCWPAPIHSHSAFGGCYDFTEEELQAQQEQDEDAISSDNKWNLPMDATQRKILEDGEEAQRRLDESPGCYWTFIDTYHTIDAARWMLADLEESAKVSAMTEEERNEYFQELHRREFEDQEAEAEEEERMRQYQIYHTPYEQLVLEEKTETEIPDYADAEDLLDEPEPRERATSTSTSTSTATTSSSKPRIAKQPQKKQKKFVPLKVTENTNRTNEVTAILTANKLEINVPKRKLQTVEAMKRHNRKWKSINTQHKQSAARGSRIPELYAPKKWDCNSYSDEE